jgi:hypothetical protein
MARFYFRIILYIVCAFTIRMPAQSILDEITPYMKNMRDGILTAAGLKIAQKAHSYPYFAPTLFDMHKNLADAMLGKDAIRFSTIHATVHNSLKLGYVGALAYTGYQMFSLYNHMKNER